jgi:uncharacterized protein (TIGR03435 family)
MRELLVLSLVAIAAAAQSQPSFEVASIRPAADQGGPLRVTGRVDADGINLANVTLRNCIQRAYKVKPYQVSGPDWIGVQRYAIVAKAAAPAPEATILQMLQTLLAERFKLVIHRESKEIPAYALLVGKSGPKLKAAEGGDGATEIGGNGGGEGVRFQRATMDALAGTLTQSVDLPVFNFTGLKGVYDFTLSWSKKQESAEPGDAPSIFTALQEQLGLRLESRKVSIEILVVDRVEKPTGN